MLTGQEKELPGDCLQTLHHKQRLLLGAQPLNFYSKFMTRPSCKGIKLGREVLDEEPRSLFGSRRLWRVRTSFRVLMWEVKLTQLTAGHGGK